MSEQHEAVMYRFLRMHKCTKTDRKGNHWRMIFCCSPAYGGPDVHLPMGGIKWLGPQIVRAVVTGVQRILYLCQVLIFRNDSDSEEKDDGLLSVLTKKKRKEKKRTKKKLDVLSKSLNRDFAKLYLMWFFSNNSI